MRNTLFVAAALAVAAVAAPASADPIVVGQWYTFVFNAAGSAFASGAGGTLGINPASISAPNPAWTFTLAGAGTLTVVDGFSSGDQFTLTDFGTAIGTTSLPVAGSSCGNDITVCLGTAAISKGVFNLAAGAHSISGTALLSPFGGGAAFFRVAGTSAVPEPASWAMMVLGFGAAGYAMRRRKAARVSLAA